MHWVKSRASGFPSFLSFFFVKDRWDRCEIERTGSDYKDVENDLRLINTAHRRGTTARLLNDDLWGFEAVSLVS